MLQMIAELGRINNQMDVRASYLCQWTEQWLRKIVATIKENTTELNKNRMRPFLDIDSDLNDKNGKVTLSYSTQYLLACGSENETETANDEAESDNSDKYIQL